ncbi:hypothetical protein, partial [Salinispora arenicola]|uniref:hypothetical protein n=1 Tax=Salinispora arenicola TaxID=168697 RepID=UPI0027DB719F
LVAGRVGQAFLGADPGLSAFLCGGAGGAVLVQSSAQARQTGVLRAKRCGGCQRRQAEHNSSVTRACAGAAATAQPPGGDAAA